MCKIATAVYLYGAISSGNNIPGDSETQLIGLDTTLFECGDLSIGVDVSDFKEQGWREIDSQAIELSFSYKLK